MPPSTTTGSGSSQIDSRSAVPTSRIENELSGRLMCRFTQRLQPESINKHQETGQNARQEQVVNRDFSDDPVQDQRQRWCEQEPEASGRRNQAKIELVAVAVLLQGRVQNSAQRDNRYAGRTGKSGKERAGGEAYQRKPPGHPSHHCARQFYEPPGRVTFTQQVPGKCEHRNG